MNAPKEGNDLLIFIWHILSLQNYKSLKLGSKDGGWSPGTDSRARMFYGKSRLIVVCGARNDDKDNDDDNR